MISDPEYRAKHDLGGRESADFEPAAHELTDLDRRIDALVNLLAAEPSAVVKPDERRLGIEELSAEDYLSAGRAHSNAVLPQRKSR
jgi:hypothetical protein